MPVLVTLLVFVVRPLVPGSCWDPNEARMGTFLRMQLDRKSHKCQLFWGTTFPTWKPEQPVGRKLFCNIRYVQTSDLEAGQLLHLCVQQWPQHESYVCRGGKSWESLRAWGVLVYPVSLQHHYWEAKWSDVPFSFFFHSSPFAGIRKI